MISVQEVWAIRNQGLVGDRYASGAGSFNKGKGGKRQITLINGLFLEGSGYEAIDTRRNIVVTGTELMDLLGRGEFQIGEAIMRAVRYCDPCTRPNQLAKEKLAGLPLFRDAFHDRGGIIAEVIRDGLIKLKDLLVPPPKSY
ncbi:MAG: hypothetical protein JWL80_88 [Parcubacteria group bacterium]|nr:hypothetical protein [Parcubacteria group bacterium]